MNCNLRVILIQWLEDSFGIFAETRWYAPAAGSAEIEWRNCEILEIKMTGEVFIDGCPSAHDKMTDCWDPLWVHPSDPKFFDKIHGPIQNRIDWIRYTHDVKP